MTPDSLYAALDEPNADVDLILGQLADWYEERGDSWRSECLQWCRREGKRPGMHGWSRNGDDPSGIPAVLFSQLPCDGPVGFDYARLLGAYQRIADAWHALRTRGEVPVAGIDSERMVTT